MTMQITSASNLMTIIFIIYTEMNAIAEIRTVHKESQPVVVCRVVAMQTKYVVGRVLIAFMQQNVCIYLNMSLIQNDIHCFSF